MLSIYDIPSKKEDLSSINQSMADLRYDEIQCQRNVTDTATDVKFAGSELVFRWDYSNGKWWLPSRSYFRFRIEITKADGSPLTKYDDIAPNMGLVDALMQQVQLKIADKTVEDISNNYAQIAALKNRLSKTGQWMRTTGNNLNFWESSFKKRQQEITQDGINTQQSFFNDSGPEIRSAASLGVDATQLDVTNTELTFQANHTPLFKTGDWIVIQAGVNDIRCYLVLYYNDLVTIQLASIGDATDLAQAVYPWWRVRYSQTFSKAEFSDDANMGIDADGVLTMTAANFNAVNGGDANYPGAVSDGGFYAGAVPGGTDYAGGFMYGRDTATTGILGKFDTYTPLAPGANPNENFLMNLWWDNSKYTRAQLLGFSANHTISGAVPAAGEKQIFTIETAVASDPIPNLKKIFRRGDFIHFIVNGNGVWHGMIWEVDPSQNGKTLFIIGSMRQVTAVAAHANNIILGRQRLGSPLHDEILENEARSSYNFECVWKPCLSIFDIPHAIPGGGKFEIVLLPFTRSIYQIKGIESSLSTKTHGSTGDFLFLIKDVRMYNSVCEGPLTENKQYILDLQETRCTNIPITSSNKTQYQADIAPSVNAISVAFQDSAVTNSSLYSNTRFKIRNDLELQLTEFYFRISQLQRPQPSADLLYDEKLGKDLLTEVYGRNIMYNGGYYDSSQETLKEWKERGFYFHYNTPRTGTDRSSRCTVSTKFSSDTLFSDYGITPNILLFYHYKKVAIVQMDNGRITSIRISMA